MIAPSESWFHDLQVSSAAGDRELFAGRFRLDGEAGVGAMGIVYRALDEHTGRPVALKVLRGTDDARFATEARALAKLAHPAIVGYVAQGSSEEGEAYLAMEWIEGESLRERLARAPLAIEETVALGLRIAQALGAAHAVGLVHRDVKPSNVLLPGRAAAHAKLADFGIARFLDVRRTPATERAIGTPGYMAPEQARAVEDIDGRADLFALGCLLFRCLANREAFEGGDAFTVIAKLVLHEPPRVRTLRAGVPPMLDDLVARLLHKDRARRPASAAAVEACLAGIARQGGASAGARQAGARSRFAAGAFAFGLTVLASGAEPSGRAPSARAPVLLTELPASPQCHGDAVASYREGLQAMHQAAWERAHSAFERGLELDPSCPEIAMRLVMTGESHWSREREREHLRRTLAQRDALRERDRAILDFTATATSADIPDHPAAVQIMDEAVRRFPNDVEVIRFTAFAHWLVASDTRAAEASLALARRATELDPEYADGWQLQGQILQQLGRMDERLAALDQCIRVAPAAGDCMRDRIALLRIRGDCGAAVAEVRRWIASDASSASAYRYLATTLAADGASRETLLEVLSARWARLAPADRARESLRDRVDLAVWTGDFEEAFRAGQQMSPPAPATVEGLEERVVDAADPVVLAASLAVQDGRLFLDAGQSGRAVETLEKAARSCQGLEQPFLHVRAHFRLGMARERTGDTRGACDAYRTVIVRWGAARPVPELAREATQRSAALGCKI